MKAKATMDTKFEGGVNIAIKIPKSKYEQTVVFYRDILKLEVNEKPIKHPTVSRTHEVKFGNNIVWLDCVDNYTHSETWLELHVDNVEAATVYLKANGVDTCDEIEQLPENMHWITDPAGTVFITHVFLFSKAVRKIIYRYYPICEQLPHKFIYAS